MPYFHRMAGGLKPGPSLGQLYAELAQRRVPRFKGQLARPYPLHAQGSLTPSDGDPPLHIRDLEASSGAGDGSQSLRTKLEWHPRLDRQEVEGGTNDSDVS